MLCKPDSCSGCPLYEGPYGKKHGYVPADGDGSSGVLIILEAAGEDEERVGRPVVGRAGQYLFSQLKRVGIERDGFRIHNVLSCRPPGNKLIKMPYTEDAIERCKPNLTRTISEHIAHSNSVGKCPVILTLGKFAFKAVMGIKDDRHPIMRADYQSYPHWSTAHKCWVLAAPHPSYIMQGKHNLAPTLQFITQRAIEIASEGLVLDSPFYLLDPPPAKFKEWVDGYLAAKDEPNVYLSYDIETPYKSGKNEDDIAREDDDDYTILRCSFAYRPGVAVSVPWSPVYMADIERLFQSGGRGLGWNNSTYDDTRIMFQMDMNIIRLDAMLAWHVLNTALPKGLGFVTPFYWKNTSMWKHLSDDEPAFYNAKDADAALRNFLGIKADLIAHGLWDIFNRHVVQLNEVLAYMSGQGVLLDGNERAAAEVKLQVILDGLEVEMQGAVPQEARKLHVYKKEPKDTSGMVQVSDTRRTTKCPACGSIDVKSSHYKHIGKKKAAAGGAENPCAGLKSTKTEVPATLWARPLEFKISKLGLTNYQKVMKHKPIIDRKEGKVTYDINAMKSLIKNYPTDPLYPIIGRYRGAQKLLGTYIGVTTDVEVMKPIAYQLKEGEELVRESSKDGVPVKYIKRTYVKGGMPVGRDGKVHATYTHNPSTLRLASQQPNMQNLPRPSKDKAALANIIRNLIVAEPGTTFLARDFSGIEAVLVGYEARDKDYMRLARRDVHSFYTAYALNQLDGRVSGNDLPLLSWDDDRLFARLADIKGEFKEDRNNLYKHLVHAINFGQGPKGAQEKIYKETDIIFDVKLIARLMDIYRELFPLIPTWQREVRLQADRDGHLRNAFGYVHRFSHVFGYKKVNNEWEKVAGDDAEAVLAFRPQSNAAGIMKEALLRLYFDRFEEAGQYLRMTIHDECFFQVPEDKVDEVDAIVLEEMERPVPQLPLPASYGMGPSLVVLTESKVGKKWGLMS